MTETDERIIDKGSPILEKYVLGSKNAKIVFGFCLHLGPEWFGLTEIAGVNKTTETK